MGKRMTLFIFQVLIWGMCHAQLVGVDIDLKTSMLVISQTVEQVAVESANNKMVDSIKAAQARVAAKTASIVIVKEAERASLQNVREFGIESRLYKNIGKKGSSLLQKIPVAMDALLMGNIVGKATALHDLGNISARATTLVNTFVDLCSNAKVVSPIQSGNSDKQINQGIMDGTGFTISGGGTSVNISGVDPRGGSRGDSHNLIDRQQRYELAYNVYVQLCQLNVEIDRLTNLARGATFGDLIYVYDRKSWNAMNDGKNTVQSTINMWNHKIK